MKHPLPCFALLSLVTHLCFAEIRLASPFSDHMVLQRELSVPVWGWAEPGETITVNFSGQSVQGTADAHGEWQVKLQPLSASDQGRDLSVHGSQSTGNLMLHDVLVGEVWLCSGQSNMDFTVAKTPKYYFAGVNHEAEEIAAANHPLIRMFSGEWQKSYTPQKTVGGVWKICTPENVPEFSAIGYFFARDLQPALDVPVGIVTLTYGASCAQAWIRREAIIGDPELKPVLDQFDAKMQAYEPPTEEELAQWQAAVEKAKAEGKRAPGRPKKDPSQDQHNPTVMFNGMIAPVLPYAIRGILWYQGESITSPRELFPKWNETLIKDWRQLWNRNSPDSEPLPFYFCQLAAYKGKSNTPEVRAWQAEALKLPHTGMAVTIDIGDPKNVHPKNKQDVGARLALIALAQTYGRKIEYSGPTPQSISSIQEGHALAISFDHTAEGLVAKEGELKTFEIAGQDNRFVPAKAHIEGGKVIVSSEEIPAPVKVRYAWSNFPEGCNLYNSAHLPAAPFSLSKE